MQKKFYVILLLLLIIGGYLFPKTVVVADFFIPYFAGDSSSVNIAEGNLAIYSASQGIFPLPLSVNSIPNGVLPTDNPTLALPDTLILFDSSDNASGLVIYRVLDGMLFVNTFVGKGNESAHSASYFGEGDFVMVMTAGPDQCADLTLNECRFSQYFLKETPFSIR